MSTPEERRQKILANSEARLAKLRKINESENPVEKPPMAPVSEEAPTEFLIKNVETEQAPTITEVKVENKRDQSAWSLLSTISMISNLLGSFSSSKSKPTTEDLQVQQKVDQQNLLVIVLGLFVSILYSFYVEHDSKLFFHILLLCCIGLSTLRYGYLNVKHRSNLLFSTLMLSGFRPVLVKGMAFIYTIIVDCWEIFSLYFVSFCLSLVLFSIF